MKKLLLLFQSKYSSAFCLLLAISCRVVNVLYVSFIGRDKMVLMLQSKSLIEGKGLGVPMYLTNNPETPVYDFTPYWPPGYALLLTPFQKIFNFDLYWTATALDIVGCIIFIFLIRRIAIELKFQPAAVNIITLLAGCFEYAFIYESLPTDIPAFIIFLSGFLLFLQELKKKDNNLTKLLFASILLFLPFTFRYSYPPLSLAVSAAAIIYGWYLQKNLMIRKGVLTFSATFLFTIVFIIFQKQNTGAAGYIVDTGKGFFPENFLHWAPIAPGAFINTFFTTSQLINRTGISFHQAFVLLEIINALMISVILTLFVFLFFKRKFFQTPDAFKIFMFLGFFISAATIISLSYLSVSYRPQKGFLYGWNYLTEPRYFVFVTLFLQLVFLGWVFLYPLWKKNLLQKLIVTTLSLLLFIEVSHNIYFYTKVALRFKEYKAGPFEKTDYNYFYTLLNSVVHENPDAEILVVSDNDILFPYIASYLGHKGIHDGKNLARGLLTIKKKTIILLALYDFELKDYQSFLEKKGGLFINRVNEVNFFRVNLIPVSP